MREQEDWKGQLVVDDWTYRFEILENEIDDLRRNYEIFRNVRSDL